MNVNSLALERTALATGWHFTFIVSPVVRSAYGISLQGAGRRAVKKIMEAVDKTGLNSFETATIASESMMGLYWVQISVNPRHLSNGPVTEKSNPYHYPHVAETSAEIFWRMADIERQKKGV